MSGLCADLKIPFLRASDKLQPSIVDGIHLDRTGHRTLFRFMKRSLSVRPMSC
jgi:hypothetical protein